MAQYRYSEISLSRGKGKSAVIFAAYCHATKMRSKLEGRSVSFYEKADQLVHSEISIPERAPNWAKEMFGVPAFVAEMKAAKEHMVESAATKLAWEKCSEQLWNSVELAERDLNPQFKRAKFAGALVISLPVEIPSSQQISLSRGFIDTTYVQHGMCADWVIHHDKIWHPHLHVILSTRCLGPNGWGRKMPEWYNWNVLLERRGLWADHANVSLGALRLPDWIDHRNYRNRGLHLVPDTVSPHFVIYPEDEENTTFEQTRATKGRQRNQAYLIEHPDHILEIVQSRKHYFTHADIRRQMKKQMEVDVTAADGDDLCVTNDKLRELCDQAFQSNTLVRVEPDAADGSSRYMTADKLNGAKSLTRKTRSLLEYPITPDSPENTDEPHTRYPNPQQHIFNRSPAAKLSIGIENLGQNRIAVEYMLSPGRITLIQGRRDPDLIGALENTIRQWKSWGFEVWGAYLTPEFERIFAEIEGIRALPLARWDYFWGCGRILPNEQAVFVLADAGMVSITQWSRILNRMPETGGKLIALRDPDQPLPSHESASWYAVEAGVGLAVNIGKHIRQQSMDDRMATIMLERGGSGARNAIEHYMRKDAIRLCNRSENPFTVLAQTYFDRGSDQESRIALVCSANDADLLNEAIRREALTRGVVDQTAIRSYGMIERNDRSGMAPRILETPLTLGPGDRITLTQPHPELGITANALGTVTATHQHSIQVTFDGDPRSHLIDLSTFRDLSYGYAITLHAAECLLTDHAFVLAHGAMNRHAMHIALTRHRNSVTVIGRPGQVDSVADLIRLAQIPGHLTFNRQDPPDPDTFATLMTEQQLAIRRSAHDLSPLIEPFAREGLGTGINTFEDDTVLSVAKIHSALIENSWKHRREYVVGKFANCMDSPTTVIEALLHHNSAFQVSDIADSIHYEVNEPETFLRVFTNAMAHPDLVPVTQSHCASKARFYSTREALRLEESALHLVDTQKPPKKPTPEITSPNTAPARLRLIRCADRNNLHQVASELVEEFERSGGTVFGITANSTQLKWLKAAGVKNSIHIYEILRGHTLDPVNWDSNTLVIVDCIDGIGNNEIHSLLEQQSRSDTALAMLLLDSNEISVRENPVLQAIELQYGATRELANRNRNPHRTRLLHHLSLSGAPCDAALNTLFDEGVFEAGATLRGAVERLAENLVTDDSSDPVAVTVSQAEADAVNEHIRSRLFVSDPRHRQQPTDTSRQTIEFKDPMLRARLHLYSPNHDEPVSLRIGDRIRFLSAAVYPPIPETNPDPQYVAAGDTAEITSLDKQGGLRMKVLGPSPREVTLTPDMNLPGWRYAYAGTIEDELPLSRDSVHILASHRMTKQTLLALMNMHVKKLRIVVPVARTEMREYIENVLRQTTHDRTRQAYGLMRSPAIQAVTGSSTEDVDRFDRGVGPAITRIRTAAGLGEGEKPEEFPDGLEGDVLADIFGAAVLTDGKPLSRQDRLSLNLLLETYSNFDEWARIEAQLPFGLHRQAAALAQKAIGAEIIQLPPMQATLMATLTLTAQMFGEHEVAAKLEAGLTLFGTRAHLARLFASAEDMAQVTAEAREGFRPLDPQIFSAKRILANVSQAEERVAFETLRKFGVRGSDRRERTRLFEAERKAGWGWRADRELQNQIKQRALSGEYEDIALVMACMVAERIEANSPVHDLDLLSIIPQMLMEVDTEQTQWKKKAQKIARKRADAELRVQLAGEIGEHRNFVIESARYRNSPKFIHREQESEWRSRYAQAERDLSKRKVTPTPLERMVAATIQITKGDERKQLADAMSRALSLGLPERSADELRSDRARLMALLGSESNRSEMLDPLSRSKFVRQIYTSFTALEIQALASGEGKLADETAQGSDREQVAENFRLLHLGRAHSSAPWSERFTVWERSLGGNRNQDTSMIIEPF